MGVALREGGLLEVHLHRSLSKNDARGVNAPAIDDSRTHVTLWLVWGEANAVHDAAARLSLKIQSPLVPFVARCSHEEDATKPADLKRDEFLGDAAPAAGSRTVGTAAAPPAAASSEKVRMCARAQWLSTRPANCSAMKQPLPWPALVSVQRFADRRPESALIHVQHVCKEKDCRKLPVVDALRTSLPMLKTAEITEVGLSGTTSRAFSATEHASDAQPQPLAPWAGEGGMQLRTFRARFPPSVIEIPRERRERVLQISPHKQPPPATPKNNALLSHAHATFVALLCVGVLAYLLLVNRHSRPRRAHGKAAQNLFPR
eukprot:4690208-Pleurochrysis_carterae.AAC.4